MSYEIKEGVDLPINDEEENRKRKWKYIIFFSTIGLIIIALAIVILILTNKKATPTYAEYSFSYSANDINSSTSLVNRDLNLEKVSEDNAYKGLLTFSTSSRSNAFIGDYETHDYLYKLSGKNPNVLTIHMRLSSNDEHHIDHLISDYSTIVLFEGDVHDKKQIDPSSLTIYLSDENRQLNVVYSSANDISIYSISYTLKIQK